MTPRRFNRRPARDVAAGLAHPAERYTLVDTALAEVLPGIRVNRRAETVPVWDAHGRVSAQDVLAPADVPRFPTSHWDGYAAMAADLTTAGDSSPVSLTLVGKVRPGARPLIAIKSGEAMQVSTGARLPSGADTVVPLEAAQVEGARVAVNQPSPPGSHVYGMSEDLKKGDIILRRGQTMRAQDLGLLISLGFRKVKVRRRPKVSVIATGTELTAARRPRAGKVVNSHTPVFLQLLRGLGCTALDLGIAKDNPAEIVRRVQGALARSDFVMTLGGTSVGEHDYIATAVASLGPKLMFRGVKLDRGRVTGISVVKGKPVLMMPGPIQGAMNAFLVLALPIIEVLSGSAGRAIEIPCVFGEAWEARRRFADFRKVVYVKLEGGPTMVARPLGAETESMMVLAEADGYVVIPENATRVDAGGRAMVRLLPGFSFA